MQPDEGGRTQPEFSQGERLARIEAEIDAQEKLTTEKLSGLRKELGAVNTAQKDAVAKSEIATEARLKELSTQGEGRADVTNQRLSALERGESAGRGASDLKASTVAWIGALAGLALVVIYIVHP